MWSKRIIPKHDDSHSEYSFGLAIVRFAALGVLIITPLTIVLIIAQHRMLQKEAARYCESRLDGLQVAFRKTQSDYRVISDIILEQVIHRVNASVLMAKALNDPKQADEARRELYNRIEPAYMQLRDKGVKQVHFHLPDNRSFLRMHRPDRFGDDLTSIRATVRLANEKKCVVMGFEEGRIFNGFRNVYPLKNQSQHVGTVEVSAPSSSILERLASEMDWVDFVIRKEVVRKKVFAKYQDNYRESSLASKYLTEQNDFVQSDNLSDTIKCIRTEADWLKLQTAMNHLIASSGQSGGATWHRQNDQKLLLVYMPIYNIEGKSVAAVLGVEKSDVLTGLHTMARGQAIAMIVCALVLVVGIGLLGAQLGRVKYDMLRTRELNRQIEQADRAKSVFLASMSHEIRTPLTAILGYSDILRDHIQAHGDTTEQIEMLDIVSRAGNHLHNIINDILDMSKIEAGKMSIEKTTFSLPHLLCDVEQMMHGRLDDGSVMLTFTAQTMLPEKIVTDPTRLKQMLINLLGNAIKFTEKGQIELTVFVRDKDRAKMLCLEVRDTGVGMTEEQVSRLFKPFSQADDSVTRKFGGTGLGLNISQRLASLMGGDVSLVSSDLGKGSCFAINLPLVVEPHTQWIDSIAYKATNLPTRNISEQTIWNLKGRILLAEDDIDNQRLIAFHLRKAGAEVVVADNGVQAFEAFEQAITKNEPFDLLLTDVQMPEMDGRSLARELRKKNVTIPIVALTAHAMESEIQACLDAGCNGYASKPIDKNRLLEDCSKWLKAGLSEDHASSCSELAFVD